MGRGGASSAAGPDIRRLFVHNGGHLAKGPVRRILEAAGYDISLGKPGPEDMLGVWGKSPANGTTKTAAHVLSVTDAFLRSVRPAGADRGAPLGLILDPRGLYFDSAAPSEIEHMLAHHPLDDSALLARARDGMARLQQVQLTRYNDFDPALPLPDAGYVLVIDQPRGAAAVEHGRANSTTFREMLVFAQEEHPGTRVVIRAHPEAQAGQRPGHFGDGHSNGLVTYIDAPLSPWKLLEGAIAVYTVSSQLGFEAIMAGHRPRVFGQPFYAGWGLSDDENPVARRERRLTRAQLFAVAMILAPTWFDPCRDRLCSFEEAVDHLEATVRQFREDRHGHVALGMRLWKRPTLQRFYGGEKRLHFARTVPEALAKAEAEERGLLVWASKEEAGLAAEAGSVPLARIEDGFLRSRGLGAKLAPPLSLVTDDLGIYYDPARESRLERLIAGPTPPGGEARAERLIRRIVRARLSKYNIGDRDLPVFPEGRRILVPGQVEDDASILCGAQAVRTNLALLRRVRDDNPDAMILYKPHPDVEAGLRAGAVDEMDALSLANLVLHDADPATLIEAVDEVWTMTSLLGFEALLRGKRVTCLGVPFYAGWGLTRDLGPVPARRTARPTLAHLAHAALIAYPRYHDPVSGLPCPAEVVAERLAMGQVPKAGLLTRSLSRLQGMFAAYPSLWR